MCPIYEFEHPENGEIFEDIRAIDDRDKPYYSPDGKLCKRKEISSSFNGWKKNKEVFEADREYVKKVKPKNIRFNDGHIEKYDPQKHS